MSEKKPISITILFAILSVPCPAAPQLRGSIEGTVTDIGGSVLSGVKVKAVNIVTKAERNTTTNSDGRYGLADMEQAKYDLLFALSGFRDGEYEAVVRGGQTTVVDAQLEPSPAGARASIAGTLSDQQGAAVADARVTAINLSTGQQYEAMTGSSGEYIIANVPAGKYSIQFAAKGFAQQVEEVTAGVNQIAQVDGTLKAGAQQEVASVTSENPLIELDKTDIATVVSERQLANLPLNDHRINAFVLLTPGAWVSGAGGSIGGQRPRSNSFVLDGVDNNHSNGETEDQQLPFDSVQEFSVSSTYPAEFGRSSGGLVNAVTKHGTNNLRGSLYYFHLNSALAARDFFESNKSRLLAHDFGFTLGGPIARDKTLFYVGYEATRALEPQPRLGSVPSEQRLTAARSLLASRGLTENLLSARILNLFPSPDRPGDFDNRAINSPATNHSDIFLVRVDHVFNSKNSVYGQYLFSRSDRLFPLAPSFFPTFRTDSSSGAQFLSLTLTSIPSNQIANVTRFSYHRDREALFAGDRSFDPSTIGLNTGVVDPQRFGLPFIKITGFDALGSPVSVPRKQVGTTWQLGYDFNESRNIHTIKAGLDFRRVSVNSRNDSGTRGRIVFDGSVLGDPLADFLGGLPSGNTGILRGVTQRGTATNSVNLYAQDNIRLRPNLTIDIGLRYEISSIVHEDGNRLSNFVPQFGGLVQVGSPQLPKLYKNDFNNFAPRIGIGWDPQNNSKMVILANWGIYYDTPAQYLFIGLGPFTNSVIPGSTMNPVGPDPVFAISPARPIPFGPGVAIFGNPAAPVGPIDLFAVEQNLKTPYVQRFGLGIKRELLLGTVFEINYVGSVGNHLFRLIDFNQPTPGEPDTRDARRPFFSRFPQFRTIDMLISAARSNYHSLSVSLRREYKNRLAFNAHYTLSKSIDDAPRPSELPQDSRNLRAERAVSSFDQRHRFVLYWVYGLPDSKWKLLRGWQAQGIFEAASGRPITPVISFDNSGTGNFVDRPDKVGDAGTRLGDRTRLFNPDAFRIPTQGTLGNVGRNSLVGPGLNNWNFSVIKKILWKQERVVEIRCEFLNLFNHPNFGMPDPIVDDPNFGRITATSPDFGHRRIRLGARITF
jgi:outer membrane receptor protein involved in Fe transport